MKIFRSINQRIIFFSQKFIKKDLVDSSKYTNFAIANGKVNGSLAQLNRASDYGSVGYRFESCASHKVCNRFASSTE